MLSSLAFDQGDAHLRDRQKSSLAAYRRSRSSTPFISKIIFTSCAAAFFTHLARGRCSTLRCRYAKHYCFLGAHALITRGALDRRLRSLLASHDEYRHFSSFFTQKGQQARPHDSHISCRHRRDSHRRHIAINERPLYDKRQSPHIGALRISEIVDGFRHQRP